MSDHEKPARDAVTAALAQGADLDKLATIVLQHVSHSARAAQETKAAVVSAVRGAFLGAALGLQDVPELALRVLEGLPNISLMMRAGPEDLMSWVMEGVADAAAAAATPDGRDKISTRIEEKFMGAGQVFEKLYDQARAKG